MRLFLLFVAAIAIGLAEANIRALWAGYLPVTIHNLLLIAICAALVITCAVADGRARRR